MRLFALVLLSVAIPFARVSADTSCYRIQQTESPENLPGSAEPKLETWCYESFQESQHTWVHAYAWEDGALDPALSTLVELNDKGQPASIAHASLMRGIWSYARTDLAGFNPLGRPLTAIDAALEGEPVVVLLNQSAEEQKQSLRAKLARELLKPSTRSKIVVGTATKMLPDAKKPYGAYWWPHNGLPLLGPLGKYDAIVKQWTGTDPKSSEWESTYHSLQHVPWGGHCNGWAASSVLYQEIPNARKEAQTGLILDVSDINGMLAEASFCVNWAFFGKRNNGQPGDDPRDPSPDRFHEVLLHYIGKLEKPVAMDYHPAEDIDNNVATGYTMYVTETAPKTYHVATTLRMHDYDHGRNNFLGTANEYSRTYSYTLTTDDAGNITGGTWDANSSNPDFLWVPLSQSNCGRENPRINPKQIEKMMALPQATP